MSRKCISCNAGYSMVTIYRDGEEHTPREKVVVGKYQGTGHGQKYLKPESDKRTEYRIGIG